VNITPRIDAKVRYRNQAAQRVLAVLAAFIGRDAVYGVTELSRLVGMNKNMVHRALTTLTAEGYLVRDRGGRNYQLGYRVLELAGEETDEFDIRTLCRPVLEELHRLTNESIFLSIIVGRSRVNVDGIEGRGRRVSHSLRGRSVPLHCTKMSRMLLSYLSDAEIAAYLAGAGPLDSETELFPDTIGMTAQMVWDDVNDIRGKDYIVWRNPLAFSGAYIAFPALDDSGRPHAIVTVGGPGERFGLERIEALAEPIAAILAPLQQQCRLFPAAPVLLFDGEARR
jgi:IclR family transcriptional regulator, KDG regulon repressor